MTTVVVPKGDVKKGEFVLIPKEEYKALVRIKKQGIRTVTLTSREKSAIAAGRKELKAGKFFTLNELDSYLDRTRARARR